MKSVVDAVFDRGAFKGGISETGEYEGCTFVNCNLAGADLSGYIFSECVFRDCDLSLAKLEGAALRDVGFYGCKMLGLRFDLCNRLGFSVNAEKCLLDNCIFYGVKLVNAVFRDSALREADFTGCDLTGAVLSGCDLYGAAFDGTVLEKADLRRSVNYSIDPARNRIRRASFSLSQLHGLLGEWDISVERES